MAEAYVAALFGLLGVLIGALVQYWCSRRTEQESRYLELKSEAYADFVNAVATTGFANEAQLAEARERLAAAKTRICVFGDREVIEAIVRLERTSLQLWEPDAKEAYLALIHVIRAHSIASGSVGTKEIDVVLFGPSPLDSSDVPIIRVRDAG